MVEPAAVARQAAAAPRLRRPRLDLRKRDTLEYKFKVQNNRRAPASRRYVVDASYTGIVPDTFKDEAEVVLKGKLTPDGLSHRPERHHGEVSVEIRSAVGRRPACRQSWPHSARFSCSPRSSSAATRRVISVVGARRRSRRLIESGIGAFYLICALMTVASAVMINAFLTDDFSIKYVVALLGQRAAALLQDHVVLGRARRLDHVLGVPAVGLRIARGLREPRAPSRADPVRRRHDLRRCRCSSCS